jgi:hypothetical protein
MKKLFYLLPLLLLALNATTISLYKDKVDFAYAKHPTAHFDDLESILTNLSPRHWKSLNYDAQISGSLGDVGSSNSSSQAAAAKPLYQGATFRGFPAAVYFSKDQTTKTGGLTSTVSASGFSWLWLTVDGLLIIGSFILAFRINRKHPAPVIAAPAPFDPHADLNLGPIEQPVIGNVVKPTPETTEMPAVPPPPPAPVDAPLPDTVIQPTPPSEEPK